MEIPTAPASGVRGLKSSLNGLRTCADALYAHLGLPCSCFRKLISGPLHLFGPGTQWQQSSGVGLVVSPSAAGSLPVETECLTRDYWNTAPWVLMTVLFVPKYIFLLARILPN